MVSLRGEIWWADMDDSFGSAPGYRRPVLVLQSDKFNKSRVNTVVVATITKNLDLANAPGNVAITARQSGLSADSVVNVSQISTLDKSVMLEYVSTLPDKAMIKVEAGLRLVLDL